MINKRTYYFLFFLSFTCVILNSCHKEEKLFARHIFGHVSDYFDGNDVEGVKVSLRYDYGSSSFGSEPPCVEPYTLATTMTDKYGEFSFDYHPLKELDDCFSYEYNYYLVFEKDGSDYFKQKEKITNTTNLRKKIEYKLRSKVTFEFKVSTVTHTMDSVLFQAVIYDTKYYPLYLYQAGKIGVNIDTTITLKTEFFDKIYCHYYVAYPPPWYDSLFVSSAETFAPIQKIYQYDVKY